MDKIILILQNKDIKIKPYKRFFHIKTAYEDRIVSYRHIKVIYLNKDIEIDFKVLLKLGSFFEIHKIDDKGDIVIR